VIILLKGSCCFVFAFTGETAVNSVFHDYKPSKLDYGVQHPDPVVENASMSALSLPDITYKPVMPKKIYEKGLLSSMQMESVVYSCMRSVAVIISIISSSSSGRIIIIIIIIITTTTTINIITTTIIIIIIIIIEPPPSPPQAPEVPARRVPGGVLHRRWGRRGQGPAARGHHPRELECRCVQIPVVDVGC
jgi:hypothetical protein